MPISVIRRILRNPKCEVYVSFMWESMNRFKSTEAFQRHMDVLFGSRDWRQFEDLPTDERRSAWHDLYRRRLKDAGATYVVHYSIFDKGRHKYSVFFGTRSITGIDRMKKAIWKVIPSGDYRFRSDRRDQMILLSLDLQPLQHALQDRFGNRSWVSIREIMAFVSSDKTIYHNTQVKAQTLEPMERKGLLRVKKGTRKMCYKYPDGCLIRFEPRKPTASG